jgi:CelD/BcsL family acetyltransferase involved in cellulose biosynthesis/GNAT superfamily N-acetyltransferase
MRENSTVELIDSFDRLLSLETGWNSALQKSGERTVFLRHEWFRCWWEAFGEKKEMAVLVLKDGGEIKAVAPLMFVKENFRGIPVRKVKFIENDNSPRCDFIVPDPEKREEVVGAILNYLFEAKDRWDVIEFNNMPDESPNLKLVTEIAAEEQALFAAKKGLNSPYVVINTDWDTFFSSRSKRFRKNLRTKKNKLDKFGPYTIEKVTYFDKSLIDIIARVSENSWKKNIDKTISYSNQTGNFFAGLSKLADERKWLSIWLMKIDGRAAAYEYHLNYENKDFALKADYDEQFAELSPGSILDRHVIENAFKEEKNEYDLGSGSAFYKTNWADHMRSHTNIFIFKNNTKGFFLYSIEFRIINFVRAFLGPLRAAAEKAYRINKFEGTNVLAARGAKKLLNLLFSANSAFWFERDLSLDIKRLAPDIETQIDLFSGEKTLEWLEGHGLDWMLDPKEITVARKNHHLFPSVIYEGKIIGCLKVGFGDVYIADYGRVVNFGEKTAFIYDTFVLPEFRGKGIPTNLISETLLYLRESKFQKVKCHIPKWNKASVSTFYKNEFKKIKYARFFRFLFLSFLSGGKPWA